MLGALNGTRTDEFVVQVYKSGVNGPFLCLPIIVGFVCHTRACPKNLSDCFASNQFFIGGQLFFMVHFGIKQNTENITKTLSSSGLQPSA